MYVERLAFEQPFRTDLDYYEGHAHGIASYEGISAAQARRDLAARHGFSSWRELRRHVEAMQSGKEPPTPFVLAYRTIEQNDHKRLVDLPDRCPDLVTQRGTNGNDLLGMAGDLAIVSLLLERGADPNRGNDYGWTKLHGEVVELLGREPTPAATQSSRTSCRDFTIAPHRQRIGGRRPPAPAAGRGGTAARHAGGEVPHRVADLFGGGVHSWPWLGGSAPLSR